MVRFAIVIAVIVGVTEVAAADCRDCTLTSTVTRAELLTAPDLVELRGEMLRIGLAGPRMGWAIECVSWDLIDTSRDSVGAFLDNVQLRGTFLTNRFTIDRERWGVWIGLHLGAVWNNGVRYFVPEGGMRFGSLDGELATIEVRPYAAFVKAIDHDAERSLTADLDADARLSVPLVLAGTRGEVRARYRDITTEDEHLRDMFAAVGFAFGPPRTARYSFGTMFVGAGVRRVLADVPLHESIERGVEGIAPRAQWQFLVWLDLDGSLVDHAPK